MAAGLSDHSFGPDLRHLAHVQDYTQFGESLTRWDPIEQGKLRAEGVDTIPPRGHVPDLAYSNTFANRPHWPCQLSNHSMMHMQETNAKHVMMHSSSLRLALSGAARVTRGHCHGHRAPRFVSRD